jgi:hypothetical protein
MTENHTIQTEEQAIGCYRILLAVVTKTKEDQLHQENIARPIRMGLKSGLMS